MGDPQNNFQNRQLALLSSALVLPGDVPRLIDEWQEVTSLWDAVRYEVDTRGEKGQFILTGSFTPKRKGILHSGVGRIGKLRMRPMSLFEAGCSSGDISLEELCNGKVTQKLIGEVDIHNLIDYIIRGGWPDNQETPIESAGLLPKEYIAGVVDDEVHRIDDIQRDKRKVELLLKSLARNESTTVTNNTIASDIKAIDDEEINKNTIGIYMDIFNRLFLTDNQKPFSSNIRSSEIKLGAHQIDSAAEQLINIKNTISAQKDGLPPSALCVICGMSNAAYRREDGVFVVPITALKN